MGKIVGQGLCSDVCAAAWSPAGAAGTASLAVALTNGTGVSTGIGVGDAGGSDGTAFIQGSVQLPEAVGAGVVGAMGWSGFSRGGQGGQGTIVVGTSTGVVSLWDAAAVAGGNAAPTVCRPK
eukprot:gene21103-13381_t